MTSLVSKAVQSEVMRSRYQLLRLRARKVSTFMRKYVVNQIGNVMASEIAEIPAVFTKLLDTIHRVNNVDPIKIIEQDSVRDIMSKFGNVMPQDVIIAYHELRKHYQWQIEQGVSS